MTRRRLSQNAIARAIAAAQAAGLPIAGLRIDGAAVTIFTTPARNDGEAAAAAEAAEFEARLAEVARHGHGKNPLLRRPQ